MCGIAGIVSFRKSLKHCRSELDSMVATLELRGPDSAGIWMDQHAAIGHRRLAVIDLDGGHQPMIAEVSKKQIVLTFAGEIYNFIELRNELKRFGHTFRTRSDTEVILRGYIEWGLDVAKRLNGMFSFAIWDVAQERLVLVRDRLGVKPLFYMETPDGLVFGSEPKTILASKSADRSVDLDGLREALAWTKSPGLAVWRGMKEVQPGELITITREGIRQSKYWQLESSPHSDSKEDTVSSIHELLEDIVERQLVADVPTCTLLSGGLDSSAITALSQRNIGEKQKIRSYAVGFAGIDKPLKSDPFRSDADGPFAKLLAEHVGTDHQEVILDSNEIADLDIRRSVIRARDLPSGFGDADNSLYLLFRKIRSYATVALSGEAADEVFGGYKWMHQSEAQQANTLPWVDHTHVTSPKTGLEIFAPELIDALDLPLYAQKCYKNAIANVPALEGETGLDARMRQICYLHLTRYLRILLDRKDRLSMAVGLEVRVPFCDHRLVNYVFNIPWSMKTFDGREKSLLRAAVRPFLPNPILMRRKAPYPSIPDQKYTNSLKAQVNHFLTEPNHPIQDLINRPRIQRMVSMPMDKLTPAIRHGFERFLDMAIWLEIYRPNLKI
jgi:asparagine synthase (glutamine-hydrolysing)